MGRKELLGMGPKKFAFPNFYTFLNNWVFLKVAGGVKRKPPPLGFKKLFFAFQWKKAPENLKLKTHPFFGWVGFKMKFLGVEIWGGGELSEK